MRTTEWHLGECQAPVAGALVEAYARLAGALAEARRLGLGRDELRALIEELLGRHGGRHGN